MKSVKVAMIAAVALTAACLSTSAATAGCYRMGETGYHWYHSCFGPGFLYPHHRHCHHGHCWFN